MTSALKAKLTAEKDAFKAAVAQRRHDVSVRRAEDDAELLEYEATCSVHYAIAAIGNTRAEAWASPRISRSAAARSAGIKILRGLSPLPTMASCASPVSRGMTWTQVRLAIVLMS